MQATGKARRKSRTTGKTPGWLGRDSGRAVLAGSLLAGLVAVAFAFNGQSPSNLLASMHRQVQAHNGMPTGEDDLTTGSILFVPLEGNACRERLIDNATWRIREGGTVDCDRALARFPAEPSRAWSSQRVEVIRGGFSKR